MSTNYTKHHAGSPCSQEHLQDHHTPGYVREGVDDANREVLDDQLGQSQHRRLSGSKGPSTQRNGASQSSLRRLKPLGQQNEVTEGLQSPPPPRSEQRSGAQPALEYVPAHKFGSHNTYRPRHEPGEPSPMDTEEYVTENPLMAKRGEIRVGKGSKQD